MERRRVVITGLGALAPNGIGKEAFWESLKEGKNCVDKITFFDASNHPSQIAAEIKDFNPKDYITFEEVNRLDRATHLAVAAAKLAIEDGNLKLNREIEREMGVIIGTGASGMNFAEKEMFIFFKEGLKKVHPYAGICTFSGATSSGISLELKLKCCSITVSTGCTGGHDAMGYAFNAVRNGMLDTVLTGGADACVTPAILGAFCRIGATSTKRNQEPKKASRPFDKDRDGFALGEGSWIFLFEELSRALKRNAHIYAEVVGYGATCDAYHMTRPLPSGDETARAISMALKDGKIHPEQVDYINAHGTSTPINDSYETMVIKKVFSDHAYKLAVSSTKSMIGHAVGAAGAGGIMAATLSINDNFIHPTINYEFPDPECDLDYVPNVGRKTIINVALCNSIAFGAKNSAIVLQKFRP